MQQPADFLTLTENYANFATSFIETSAGIHKYSIHNYTAITSFSLQHLILRFFYIWPFNIHIILSLLGRGLPILPYGACLEMPSLRWIGLLDKLYRHSKIQK